MPANRYRFEEQWTIPNHRPHEVYEVLYNATLLPHWWSDVYLEAVPLANYARPVVGAKVRARARGFLPYTLRFVLEALTLDAGRHIEVRATGDFEGIWRAELFEDGEGTRVEIDWTVKVDKPIIRWLSPILKPLFAWNHRWTTPRAERGLIEFLTRRRQVLSLGAARPQPVSSPARAA